MLPPWGLGHSSGQLETQSCASGAVPGLRGTSLGPQLAADTYLTTAGCAVWSPLDVPSYQPQGLEPGWQEDKGSSSGKGESPAVAHDATTSKDFQAAPGEGPQPSPPGEGAPVVLLRKCMTPVHQAWHPAAIREAETSCEMVRWL